MMFFKKKNKEEEPKPAEAELDEEGNLIVPVASSPHSEKTPESSDVSVGMLTADFEKLKAQFSTFYELQKTSTERFSMINQQIGELRSMLIDRDKAAQHLEAKATQAIDIVKTVQPDKLMIEMRKTDGKIEALRANLESTENTINNVVNEIKEVKNKMNVFRGMEQVISLNEEAKKELMDIKKVQAIVERHADKVETVFTEMQKKSSEFVKVGDTVKDLDKSFKQISSEFDSIKIKISDLAHKKEVENLISKFDDFENYAGNILKLINSKFEKMEKELGLEFNKKFEETDKLLKGFEMLSQKIPDLDKYFNLLQDEAKKVPPDGSKVEKIKEIGEESPEVTVEPNNPGIFGKIKGFAGKFKK